MNIAIDSISRYILYWTGNHFNIEKHYVHLVIPIGIMLLSIYRYIKNRDIIDLYMIIFCLCAILFMIAARYYLGY